MVAADAAAAADYPGAEVYPFSHEFYVGLGGRYVSVVALGYGEEDAGVGVGGEGAVPY